MLEWSWTAWAWLNDRPWLEFIQALFDLVKGVAWPLSVLFIASWFKDEIRALLPRVRKAGPNGLEIDPEEQKHSADAKMGSASTETTGLPEAHPAVAKVAERIRMNLQEVPDDQRLARLTLALAETQLVFAYERINRIIFGSQLQGLRLLNERRNVSQEEAKRFFEQEAQGRYPEAYVDFSFNDWLSFLIRMELVEIEGTRIRITIYGQEFLIYLTRNHVPEARPL